MVSKTKTDNLLNIHTVARILHVHVNTVRRWTNEGYLKSYRVGSRGARRFRQEDLTEFIEGSIGTRGGQGS